MTDKRAELIRASLGDLTDKELARHLTRVLEHHKRELSPLHRGYLAEAADRLTHRV